MIKDKRILEMRSSLCGVWVSAIILCFLGLACVEASPLTGKKSIKDSKLRENFISADTDTIIGGRNLQKLSSFSSMAVVADQRFCRAFFTSKTANATRNTCYCAVEACEVEVLHVQTCNCQGVPILRFFDGTSMNVELGENIVEKEYNTCGNGCPSYYLYSNNSSSCSTMSIVGGCEDDDECAARVKIQFFSSRANALAISDMLNALETSIQATAALQDDPLDTDDEYVLSPNPYLPTYCSLEEYNHRRLTFMASLYVIVLLVTVCFGLSSLAFCCLRQFRPDLFFGLLACFKRVCFSLIGFCDCGLPSTMNYKLFNSKSGSKIIPASAEVNIVELTPWERNQGFFQHVENDDGSYRRQSSLPWQNSGDNADIDDDDDDNISRMGELEDDDPRVLRKLAKKLQSKDQPAIRRSIAYLHSLHQHLPQQPHDQDFLTQTEYAPPSIFTHVLISQKTARQPFLYPSYRSQSTVRTTHIYTHTADTQGFQLTSVVSSGDNSHRTSRRNSLTDEPAPLSPSSSPTPLPFQPIVYYDEEVGEISLAPAGSAIPSMELVKS